jgi:hypothetical protein
VPVVPLPHLLLAAALGIATVGLGLVARGWYRRLRLRARWAHARRIEREAAALLSDLGYQVLERQAEATYTLLVDGQPTRVSLRADYLVARAGRRFVAEVKSGRDAPRLETAATRRQLLEYGMAFHVDGLLLVDGETREVREVAFPRDPRRTGRGVVVGFLVGLAVAAAFAFWVLVANRILPWFPSDDSGPTTPSPR